KTVKPKNNKKPSQLKVAYKRVDQLWDETIHNYKLTKTVKNTGDSEWDQYIFTVRRRFDTEHKYLGTIVDIKSRPLKECLQVVFEGIQGVSLHDFKPQVDPNMLFLHLEDMRSYVDLCQNAAVNSDRIGGKEDLVDEHSTKAKHLEVMVKYLDKDYDETKKSLRMLENGQITFDLLWALYKPGIIAYCATYGDHEEPRAFKIDAATKQTHFSKGTWYSVEGRYLDYDGKTFGMTGCLDEVPMFEGARDITDLECYPLKYHKDAETLEAELIQRGKQFVSLQGMNYRYYNSMAYQRVKKGVMKINIDGRIMVDAAVHRRVNPNYRSIPFKPKTGAAPLKLVDAEEGKLESEQESSTDEVVDRPRCKVRKYRFLQTADGKRVVLDITGDKSTVIDRDFVADPKETMHEFTSEELIVASPVVLGFAFAEKLWLEFKVSAISEVVYNAEAFDSLVLPESQKSLVKALVSSHSFQGHKSIDDIISGKGRGLVAVLHGPPGTGKTLTAEGIADLLKRPLYMVSAGDLGTEATRLEKELQNVLDVAHSWGAILLLDEADVFLQERSIHDIHRNALASIFLRLLEYFQGILFLTTNRVETFDTAFVSRIHLSLRFQPLTTKAKKTVWKLFIDRVKKQEGMEVAEIRESDITDLARRDVNGRQIKNLVRAAQALAVYEDVPLSMMHIRRVIDVVENFEVDLKGGTGFTDAMRSECIYSSAHHDFANTRNRLHLRSWTAWTS
ncbi:P-loop containing nucleoside triphosphate hydrolase protein, partial [Exophiala viscosa]